MNSDFQFKEFKISQNNTAMKVGTDGVLLGAWANIDSTVNAILDIGAGTGLIALMCAQRSEAEIIDAVELDAGAYIQAVENFENSQWGDRLFCFHASAQELADDPEELYDLIISNPPYFNSETSDADNARKMARQTISLTFEELIDATVRLMSETGSCAFIIPYESEKAFVELAKSKGMHLNRLTHVRGTSASKVKRSLIQFSYEEGILKSDELIIEIARHEYTTEYKQLVKDFYLKM